MSEEYPNQGTVRRRPRTSHQRSHSQSRYGQADSGQSETRNGHSRRPGFRASAEREEDFEEESPRSKRRHQQRPWEDPEPRKALPYRGAEPETEEGFKFPFDPWRLYGAVKRNLPLILIGGLIVAVAGFALAAYFVQYRVTVALMRKTASAFQTESSDQIALRQYTDQTVFSFMKSGEVLRRVAVDAASNPILAGLNVTPKLLAEADEVKEHGGGEAD